MDTLKKGYVINNTLDLSSRVMSLDAAKDVMLHCTTVSGKTLTFSSATQDLIAGDYEAKLLVGAVREKGWTIPIRSTVTGTVTSGTSSVSIRINGTSRSVTCTNGAFTYTTTDVITSLDNFIYNNNTLLSVDMHRMDLYSCTSITNAFNSSRNLASINASGLDTRNVTTFQAFAHFCTNSLNSPNLQNIDTSSATSLRRLFSSCQNMVTLPYLPKIPSDCDTSLMFDDCPRLVTINACGPISETVSFASSPLTIFSARVILRQLQTVTSETLTFSSTTKGYINADPEALSLVTAARNKGWTISLS